MQTSSDKLAGLIDALAGAFGRRLTDGMLLGFKMGLSDLPEQVVEGVVLEAIQRGGEFPSAGTLRELALSMADGRPTAEQAWALIPKSECDTGYVTQEMMNAWITVYEDYADGNRVGARIGFIKAYDQEVRNARAAMRPPKGWISHGISYTQEERAQAEVAAIEQAHAMGAITDQRAARMIGEAQAALPKPNSSHPLLAFLGKVKQLEEDS